MDQGFSSTFAPLLTVPTLTGTDDPWGWVAKPASFRHASLSAYRQAVVQVGSAVRAYDAEDGSYDTLRIGVPANGAHFDCGVGVGAELDATADTLLTDGCFTPAESALRFRFPVDPRKPVISTGRNSHGDVVVLYHTAGSSYQQGVVAARRNLAGCFNQ